MRADQKAHAWLDAMFVAGRGDPFASLGWAKRLRDYFDAVIQKQYAGAAYQWWIKVRTAMVRARVEAAKIASTA